MLPGDGPVDLPMMSDEEYIKRLELEVEGEENEDEWKRIVYYLVDAVDAQRGMSIPEDVEHAKLEIERLQANVKQLRTERDDLARDLFAESINQGR